MTVSLNDSYLVRDCLTWFVADDGRTLQCIQLRHHRPRSCGTIVGASSRDILLRFRGILLARVKVVVIVHEGVGIKAQEPLFLEAVHDVSLQTGIALCGVVSCGKQLVLEMQIIESAFLLFAAMMRILGHRVCIGIPSGQM